MDWLMVKESNFKSAGNGLFTCVQIDKGTTVTYYMGNEKEVVDDTRQYTFSTSYQHTAPLGWHMDKSVGKKGGSNGTVIDAIESDRDSWEYGDNLYLGAHMINDPSFSMKEGYAGPLANCRWHSKCEVIASRDIKAGEELTVNYQENVTKKRRMTRN